MFKLDKRKDFIPYSNGLASGKVSLKEDINKRILGFNRTKLKTIHQPLSIIFKSKGNEIHPHNINYYLRNVYQRTTPTPPPSVGSTFAGSGEIQL